MNERTKQLIEQATESRIGHGAFGEPERCWELNPEKLVELVVRECATVVQESQAFYNEHNDGIINTDLAIWIKARFGLT